MKLRLTDTAIRAARHRQSAFKLTDGGGLYLLIQPSRKQPGDRETGRKLWRYRYRIGGKENLFAIGEYPTLSLAEARDARNRAAELVGKGIHPAHQRKLDNIRVATEHSNTLELVAREWVAARDWEAGTKAQWMRMLEADVFSHIGTMPMRQVEPAHILDILKRVEKRAPTRAAQIRRALSGTFELGISTLRADRDPVWPVRKAIQAPRTNHKRPLTPQEIGEALRGFDGYRGNLQTKIAFRMLWYTLARPNEVMGARWDEIDIEAATWHIPAARMKMKDDHVVPLPDQAIFLLQKLEAINGDRALLFPNRDDPTRPATDNALRVALREIGFAGRYSPHATRTTGSTLLNEMGFRADVIERQLAHQERDKVRKSYNRAQYLDERREMMQSWSDYVDNLAAGGAVIPIRKRK